MALLFPFHSNIYLLAGRRTSWSRADSFRRLGTQRTSLRFLDFSLNKFSSNKFLFFLMLFTLKVCICYISWISRCVKYCFMYRSDQNAVDVVFRGRHDSRIRIREGLQLSVGHQLCSSPRNSKNQSKFSLCSCRYFFRISRPRTHRSTRLCMFSLTEPLKIFRMGYAKLLIT